MSQLNHRNLKFGSFISLLTYASLLLILSFIFILFFLIDIFHFMNNFSSQRLKNASAFREDEEMETEYQSNFTSLASKPKAQNVIT